MKSQWKSFQQLEPDREYIAMASSIPARDHSSTWRMFRGSTAIRKQLASTDGVIGFSLLARPIRKQYATLSVWIDEDALGEFVAASPHQEVMTGLRPAMGPTRFVRWTIDGADGRPSWTEALDRLARPVGNERP
jgi:heme-degrading monooxygenase HmoA